MKWTRRTRRFARQRGAQWPVDYNSNADRQPVFEVLETDFGLAIAARREAGPDEYYWRITPFMLPCYTIVPRAREQNYIFTAAVPIDDLTMFGMTVFWSPDGPIRPMPVVDVDEHFRAKQTKRTITWSTANCRRRTASPVFAACASRTWRSRRTSAGAFGSNARASGRQRPGGDRHAADAAQAGPGPAERPTSRRSPDAGGVPPALAGLERPVLSRLAGPDEDARAALRRGDVMRLAGIALMLVVGSALAPVASAQCADPVGNAYCKSYGQTTYATSTPVPTSTALPSPTPLSTAVPSPTPVPAQATVADQNAAPASITDTNAGQASAPDPNLGIPDDATPDVPSSTTTTTEDGGDGGSGN